MVRVNDSDDPRRCRGQAYRGQCWHTAEPYSHYCKKHGGCLNRKKNAHRMYQLTKARHRDAMARFVDAPEAKSLREEIALARTLLEEHMNRMESDIELMQSSAAANQLIVTLDRLIKTATQTERGLNELLSKTVLVAIGKRIGEVIAEELVGIANYEQIIDRLIPRVCDVIQEVPREVPKVEAAKVEALEIP